MPSWKTKTGIRTAVCLMVVPLGLPLYHQELNSPRWRKLASNWPDTTNQVRAMLATDGGLFIGTGGSVRRSAGVWKLESGRWRQHAEFDALKVVVLETDELGNLYAGTGTPHSAETPGMGAARIWRIGRGGEKTLLRSFPHRDMVYSMTWFRGKLHVGTMTEDLPGTAEIWRFDNPGWTLIAGAGVNHWPRKNSYAAVYEMWVHDDTLIAGTFGRTLGDGDVLQLQGSRWVDLKAPGSIIALSFETYQDQLVVALSNHAGQLRNPIQLLHATGVWRPLGDAPPEWERASIHNHLLVVGKNLFVGVGGPQGTLSVWRYDGQSWLKLAGDGIYRSWVDPIVSSGAEWVYRLAVWRGKLYAGLACDRSPFQAQVWEMTF